MKHFSRFPAVLCLCAVVGAGVLYCAGYKMILPSDLDYKKCWLSKPSAGIEVSASKQPLFETRNNRAYDASVKRNIGIFAVKIQNSGIRPLKVDSAHVLILDGSGNRAEVIRDPAMPAKVLKMGQPLRDDLASYSLWGNVLEPGKSYCALICVATSSDPYFATYFLRFLGENGEVLTDARF